MRETLLVFGIIVLVSTTVSVQDNQGESNTLTPTEAAEGWELPFDGQTTNEWRGFKQSTMPAGWQAVDGALTRVGEGGDIVTKATFENFDLQFEWKIETGGNSGVFFRVTEDEDAVWHTAPEMQVLDDDAHPDGQAAMTSAGSDYALYGRSEDVVKPVGEWNHSRIVVNGSHVKYWLNNVQVVDYELWSDDWEQRVAASKFAAYPNFGRARRGHFALQDHGNPVYYRNIKVRELPSR